MKKLLLIALLTLPVVACSPATESQSSPCPCCKEMQDKKECCCKKGDKKCKKCLEKKHTKIKTNDAAPDHSAHH